MPDEGDTTTTDTGTTDVDTTTQPDPTTDQTTNTNDAGDKGKDTATAKSVADLPEWAQKQIRDARKEAADRRGDLNRAQQTQQQQMDAIAVALGIKKDGDTKKADPEQLAAALASRDAEVTQMRTERAAEKSARKAGADVDALMDSRKFSESLGDLDPSDKNFQRDLDALVETTLKNNPKYKAGLASTRSSVDHSGGTGERRSTDPMPLTSAVANHYGT